MKRSNLEHIGNYVIAICVLVLGFPAATAAQTITPERLDELAVGVEQQVIEWRHDIHANPELGNSEFRTAALVAEHLAGLGLEVRTGIAHTGVLGILRGGRPGPVIALRADMDALPVTEQTDVPFASKVRSTYNGNEVGVMHACGHDTHTAMLMGLAEVLAAVRNDLPGTVMFVFQPAEESLPGVKDRGAEFMLREGVFEETTPDAMLGLHVSSALPSGVIAYRAGPALASADVFRIFVQGKQTHAAAPWAGVDPVVVAAQIIMATQSIVSRQVNIAEAPAIISFGSIHGGNRNNIIPDEVQLLGTIRTYDQAMRTDIHRRLRQTATAIAESAGAEAKIEIEMGVPPVQNDAALTEVLLPALQRAVGASNVRRAALQMAADDFAYFAETVPATMVFLGITPEGTDPSQAPANHSSLFYVDEGALISGVKALAYATVGFLENAVSPSRGAD